MCRCFYCPSPKKAMILINGFFFFFALCLLSLGIWIYADKSFQSLSVVRKSGAPEPFIIAGGTVLLVIGSLSFIVSSMGLCGACSTNEECVFFYVSIMLMLVTGEATAAVIFGLYRDEIKSGFEASIQKHIRQDYLPSNKYFYATWNFVMFEFACCGSESFDDFYNSAWWNITKPQLESDATAKGKKLSYIVPEVCCKPNEAVVQLSNFSTNNVKARNITVCQLQAANRTFNGAELNPLGCYQSLINWMDRNMIVPYTILTFIGAIQLAGLLSGCLFRRQVMDLLLGELQYIKS